MRRARGLRKLRADLRTKSLPTFVLTSSKQEADIVESYALAADSYVPKPVEFQRFSETFRQLGLYWFTLDEAPPPSGSP